MSFYVDGNYSADCAGKGKGDEVYPAEFDVFETVEGGENQKREKHIGKSRNRAFEQAVLRLLEAYKHADEYRYDFDCDIDGHNDFVFH